MEEIVHDMGALIDAGKLRAWGVLNWKPELIAEAVKVAAAQGVEPPCAAQLAYSLVRRSPVEDAEMAKALDAAGTSVGASFTLDGGALTGKYAEPGATGRLTEHPNDEFHKPAIKPAGALHPPPPRPRPRSPPNAIPSAPP